MIKGSCHCGQVKWSYANEIDGVTACNCTLCRKYGALWAYGHLNHGIEVSGPTSTYERGNKHNKFNFCSNCGCVCYYLSNKEDEQGRRRIAVNVRMADDANLVAHYPIDHFDGFDKFEDLPRDHRCVKDLWY